MSSIAFTSVTEGMHTALINSRLKAADPTIVDGPSSPAGSPSLPIVSTTESKISGAEEPRAMRERFAMVGFQTGTSIVYSLPFLSYLVYYCTVDVITSIASIKRSAMI